MYKYKICVQFVNPMARFNDVEKKAVEEGVTNYNTRSLIAKNSKQISVFSFSDDGMTLNIALQSEANLPPNRKCRVFLNVL